MRIAIDINDVLRDFTGQFKKQYIKHIDGTFEIDDEDIKSSDLFEVFPFNNREQYEKFRYLDCPYEIYGRAEPMVEANLTIQATYAFLAKLPTRAREVYFPIDSSTVWDRCDILITANPLFLNNIPEGKIAIKVNMPYNKDIECKYSFNSMMDIIDDSEDTIISLIEEE